MSDQHYICTAYYMASFMTQTMTLRKKVTFLFFFYLFIFSFVCGNTWKKQTQTTNKIYLSKQLKYISKTPYPQNREGNQGGRQTNIKINSLITILTEQRNDQKSYTHNTLMSLVYLTTLIMIIYIVFTYKYVVCVI